MTSTPHTSTSLILDAALAYAAAGCKVMPLHSIRDGACTCKNGAACENTGKHPRWDKDDLPNGLKNATTDPTLIRRWWRRWPDAGLAVVDEEGLDFDNKGPSADELYNAWAELVELETPGLIDRLVVECTRSGGYHVLWRCAVIEKNQKLAQRPPTAEEVEKAITLIETRGKGGYLVVAPTPGYELLRGSWDALPEITADERALLLRCARLLDRMPEPAPVQRQNGYTPVQALNGLKPGADYNARATPEDVVRDLESIGWAYQFSRGPNRILCRPGKRGGVSGTVHDNGTFYCFTSSAAPFEPGEPYAPFAVRALTRHNGDFKEAARQLGRDGYGEQRPHSSPPAELYEADSSSELDDRPLVGLGSAEMPALPARAQLPAELGRDACPWLDSYIRFSRTWSPRSYDDAHEACGLWLLSTIAGRRVELPLGKLRYPSLYLALCARTSLYAKSSAAEIATDILGAAGLSLLKASDDSTPQAFIAGLVAKLPEDFGELPEDRKARLVQRAAFAAQRGWFFEEFGQKITAMMRDGGFMADFRGLLRRFDDAPPEYEYQTIGRGSDRVERPYLALLASLTPADLAPFAKRGAALWNDGFFARFAFITPPPAEPYRIDRFPAGERIIPDELVRPLRAWHQYLGIPIATPVERTDKKGKPSGLFDLTITQLPSRRCTFGEGVFDAYYRYDEALRVITASNTNADMDGSYTRLPEKALRVAMLLASIDNEGRIEMRHWARAQQIAERWRQNLHNLMAQLQEDEPSVERTIEDKIVALLAKNERALTPREVSQGIRGLSAGEALYHLDRMAGAGLAVVEVSKKTRRYRLTSEADKRRRVDSVDMQTTSKNVYTRHNDEAITPVDTNSTVPTVYTSTRLHTRPLSDGEASEEVLTANKDVSTRLHQNGYTVKRSGGRWLVRHVASKWRDWAESESAGWAKARAHAALASSAAAD